MSAADAQAKCSHAGQIPILRILMIAWLVLWLSGGSQLTVHPSYPGAARTGRGLCPYSDQVFASLTNAVSSPTIDWSRCCVPLNRSLKIAWRVLWVAGGSQQTVRPSYPSAAQSRRGLCPYSDRVFASLTNAVSSPTIGLEQMLCSTQQKS